MHAPVSANVQPRLVGIGKLIMRSLSAAAGSAQGDVFDDEAGGWKRQGKGKKRAVTRGQTTVQVG